jgi:8-oxo-dGTP diphosphatase
VSRGDNLVRAAGGVVTRARVGDPAGGALEFLVVHRPRYDDWSLPKGKLEPGETFEDAARREVEEETGMRVELGVALPTSEYADRHGRPKVVHYWWMTPVAETPFVPNEEADEARWITAAEAATLLTYEHDRSLVAAVDELSRGGQS